MAKYVRVKIQEVRKYSPDWQSTEIGINKDPAYVLMVIPLIFSVSLAVETIKENTNRRRQEKFRFLNKGYWELSGMLFDNGGKARDKRRWNSQKTCL